MLVRLSTTGGVPFNACLGDTGIFGQLQVKNTVPRVKPVDAQASVLQSKLLRHTVVVLRTMPLHRPLDNRNQPLLRASWRENRRQMFPIRQLIRECWQQRQPSRPNRAKRLRHLSPSFNTLPPAGRKREQPPRWQTLTARQAERRYAAGSYYSHPLKLYQQQKPSCIKLSSASFDQTAAQAIHSHRSCIPIALACWRIQ